MKNAIIIGLVACYAVTTGGSMTKNAIIIGLAVYAVSARTACRAGFESLKLYMAENGCKEPTKNEIKKYICLWLGRR